jgi:hypothetical protein
MKYNINAMELSPSWEASSHSDSQEFPNILWNMKFITMCMRVSHLILFWTWIWPKLSQLIYLKSTFTLSSRLCLDPSFYSPIGIPFPPDVLHTLTISSAVYLNILITSVMSTTFESPHYAKLTNILPLHPSLAKIFLTLKNGVFWVVTPCGSCKNQIQEPQGVRTLKNPFFIVTAVKTSNLTFLTLF